MSQVLEVHAASSGAVFMFLDSLFGTARRLSSRYVPGVCSPQERDQSLLMEAFIADASGRQNKV